MGVLLAWMSTCCLHAWCLKRPEENATYPATGIDGSEPLCRHWVYNTSPLKKPASVVSCWAISPALSDSILTKLAQESSLSPLRLSIASYTMMLLSSFRQVNTAFLHFFTSFEPSCYRTRWWHHQKQPRQRPDLWKWKGTKERPEESSCHSHQDLTEPVGFSSSTR